MRLIPQRTGTLTAEELYLFDTMGFLRIPAFLRRETVEACRSEVLRLPSRFMEGRGDKERFDDLVASIAACQELAASQAVRACVEPLINQPYRLIESYALRRDQDSVFYLHNGNSEILRYGSSTVQRNTSFSHTFHDGKLFCMFVKVDPVPRRPAGGPVREDRYTDAGRSARRGERDRPASRWDRRAPPVAGPL
jgi:hypothetical protein